jgi:tetratricopeptide (TPR) repeat protein
MQPMNKYVYLSQSETVPETSKSVRKSPTEAISREIIGERVRQARVAAHLTQQELAGNTYSKSYISAVERGKMTPSFQALHVLAERLGRSISFFLGEGEVDLDALAQSSAAAGVPEEERQQREGEARQMLKEAEEWVMKRQPDKVLEALRVAEGEPPVNLPLSEQPRWYWLAGRASISKRKFPEAIGWFERGLTLVETRRAQVTRAQKARFNEMGERMRELLGGCYYQQSQPARALDYHLRCLRAITDRVVTDPELKLMIYQSLGNDNMALGRHNEAIGFYEQARELAQDVNDPRQAGLAYWGLGLIYKSSDDLFHAEAAFREALMIFERLDNTSLASQLHMMLGQVLTRLKDYEKADRHLRLALETAERLGDPHLRRGAWGNIAILCLEQGHPDEAVKAAQESLSIVLEKEDPRTEGQIYQTLAEGYEAGQDVAAAEQAYQRAIKILEQTQDGVLIGRAHERYGQFLATLGRFQEAYEQMGQARALLDRKPPAK